MTFLKAPQGEGLPRFRQYFPVAAWIIQNVWLLFPIFAIAAVFIGLRSVHYGLSLMSIWLGLVCFWVDRKHLDYCLLTPLQPMATILIMSQGLGISMVVHDSAQKYQYGFLAMQLVGLLGFPFFIGAYYIVTKDVPGFVFPRLLRAGNSLLTRPLMFVGWFCLLYELGKVLAGVVSGSMDRGYAGDFQVDTPFGWWSMFAVFLRLQTMGFLLVPLIWRESRILGRTMVAGVVATILFLHFVAASRGAVFYPLFILLIGSFMFIEFRRLKYEAVLLVGIFALFPFVTLMANYRSTEAFHEADLRNIFKKLGTMKDGLARKAEMEESSGERLTEAGQAFIGVADQLIYEMTPDTIPHEGFGRLGDLLWIYVPNMFASGAHPVLLDGNPIVVDYTGINIERSTIGITWSAEMYRRWGWGGVPVGLLLYGLFYGAIFRFIYNLYLYRNALWGFMLCGLAFNFFISWFFHTVLTTCWFWFYDIPKHLLLLACFYFVAKMLSGSNEKIPGALELTGRTNPLHEEGEAGSNRPHRLTVWRDLGR